MRIGLIIYGKIDTITGGYIYDHTLIKYLTAKGCEVRVFSQTHSHLLSNLKNNFSFSMRNEILKYDPDILLQDEMNFASLFLMNNKIKKCLKKPIISIVHLLNASNRNFLIQKIEYQYLKSLDGFIFNSYSTQKKVKEILKHLPNSIVAEPGKDRIPLNVDKPFILDKIKNNELHILFLGNLFYNKGLHVLLQALAKIELNSWRLSIAGNYNVDLNYSKKILQMMDDLTLKNNIRLLGVLNQEGIADAFKSHHVLAVPSYFESYGMSYVEAMGAGLPVIAPSVGGCLEIITNDINGFLVDPGNVEMVRVALTKLIKNRDLLAKMSLASLARYQELPSWNHSMEKIYHYFEEIKKPASTRLLAKSLA